MRRALITLTVLAGLVLAGCGGVPTSGDVRWGNEQPAPANQPGGVVQYKPEPPQERADRETIVNGFLDAMIDPANADIARLYLTKAAAASWRPAAQTTVYDSTTQGKPREAPDSTVVLEANWVGTLDQRGSWHPPESGQPLKYAFRLVNEGPEWRIANPPRGTLIGQDQLTLVYNQYNLYFFNPAMDQLVPDPVYLPRTGTIGQLATRLTEALLQGPTGRLGPDVVKTAAPPNAKFNVSVPVEAGVASVALDDTVARLGVNEKEQLAAQITWTLRPVVTEVKLTAADVPLVEGGSEVRTIENFGRYDPMVQTKQLYVGVGNDIARVSLSDGVASLDSSVRSTVSEYETESFAVDLGNEPTVAVVIKGGGAAIGKLTEPTEQPTDPKEKEPYPIETLGKRLRPSFDKAGNLWIVDKADQEAPRIRFVTPDQAGPGEPQKRETYEVSAPELADKRVSAIRVAPDGARVLLVTRSGGESVVYIAGVVRNDDVINLRLGRPIPVPLSDVDDAGWSASDKFMVLGNDGGGANQVREVSVDGSTDPLQGLSAGANSPIHLAVAPSTDALLVVGDDRGMIRIRGTDNSWRDSLSLASRDGASLHHPAYPG